MRLADLAAELEVVTLEGDLDVDVTSLTHDSRRAAPGALFCCVPGRRADGHRHATEAVARGAVALLAERHVDVDVPQVLVGDARVQMGRAAAAFWGHPSRRLRVVGVTGTNGKTTTTWMLRAVLEAAGLPTGVIGTLGGARTTPEAPDLQAELARLADGGAAAVAMEVSSHALALSRVEGTRFDVTVFTNLGHDHLDFHESLEQYFAVKARLFEPELTSAAVVNLDDPHGRLLLEACRVPTRGYSLSDVGDVEVGLVASACTWRGRRMQIPFGGVANLSNALAAATAAVELGVEEDAVIEGLRSAPPIPGRYEVIDAGQPFTVVVDYAHTPDALRQLLTAARAGTEGRLTVVFGCGGDRDVEKRPLMGRVAATLADAVVVTSDNPRHDDPSAIAEQVVAGADGPAALEVELDRRAAIRSALASAQPGDAVLVAGKGHETTQTVGTRTLPFDDRDVVRDELASLGLAAGERP
ncbi:MAG: UDP-N-acetylmuramoyl-L-alanyl-D-glutamate--2,6-diaminopimelate ligase [Actinobacteria bacterium]|nr:UDP-N-acetylmuramoyl-L-alanyl-D-glutamate--2,6-diaminopimelate ligase [Actinomycetota bacterium]